ncbi:hypothetical protein ACFQ6Q_00235 [Streptomyces sp. NPDC056437]|uniref:hypothetical protein n=1 Tax=Streptomyces sp. NPDC056437 TaxID=3345816 RepID=UPI0036D1BB2F
MTQFLAAVTTGRPQACLLHADIHPMQRDCWGAVFTWQVANDHLEGQDAHDAYQAAVERRMLDQIATN